MNARHIEQPRNPKGSPMAGAWREDAARATAGEAMPDAGAQGTLAFPDPSIGKDTETYIRFFSEAPIPERALSNAVAAYDRYMHSVVRPETRRRVDDYFSSDQGKAELQGMSDWQIDDAFERERKRVFEIVRKEKNLPEKLSAPMAASAVRAGQMSNWRGLLGDDEAEDVVMDHRMPTAIGELSVGDLVDKYKTRFWLNEAVTAAGDLKSQWRMEELLEETRKANAYNQRLLTIEQRRDIHDAYSDVLRR